MSSFVTGQALDGTWNWNRAGRTLAADGFPTQSAMRADLDRFLASEDFRRERLGCVDYQSARTGEYCRCVECRAIAAQLPLFA